MQVVLVLLVIGIVTVMALRFFQRSPIQQTGGGPPARSVLTTVELQIEGLESSSDAAQAEEAVRRLPGVASITIDAGGRARVTYNPQQTNPDRVMAALGQAGYRARR